MLCHMWAQHCFFALHAPRSFFQLSAHLPNLSVGETAGSIAMAEPNMTHLSERVFLGFA